MDNYSVAVLFKNRIQYGEILGKKTITIGSGKKDNISMDRLPESLIRVNNDNKGLVYSVKHPYNISKQPFETDKILIIDSKIPMGIVAARIDGRSPFSMTLPYNGVLRIGRGSGNHIIIRSRFVSSNHLLIRMDAGVARFEDLGSTNGVYLNGIKTSSGRLKSGDLLSIINLKILYENNTLSFLNMRDILRVAHREEGSSKADRSLLMKNDGMPVFQRSPRMMSQLPDKEITLAPPPGKGQKFEKRGGMFASILGTGSMFAASMAMGAASPAYLAMRAASLISPIASVSSHSSENKKRKKQLEKYEEKRRMKYGRYIQDQRARIESVARDQRAILTQENPSPEECIAMVSDVNRRLFERTPSDRDFLDVRIGMGYEELCVPVKSFSSEHEFYMENDEVKDLLSEMIEETRFVDYIPFRLMLNKYYTVGLIGDRAKVVSLVRNLIIELTASHFYRDVKIVGVFDEDERPIWNPLRWFPHIWDDNKDNRFLAFSKEEKEILCERMNSILDYRKRSLSKDYFGNDSRPMPHYIFIAGSKNHLKNEVIMKNLMMNQKGMGISVLFLFDDIYSIPHGCQCIVDLTDHCVAYESDKENLKTYFTMDSNVNRDRFDRFARKMSAIKVDGFFENSGIPESISFLEGYGVKRVEDLNIIRRWKAGKSYETLAAPIGQMGGGKTFYLDVGEKGHGPHGLVAGTTGSGKSELLISWILSMAVNYHPHDVAFVLIDYKGGGMANLLEGLPHVVGKITNIGSNINRSLISLQSETNKRMMLFDHYSSVTGLPINNINQYQKLYKEGRIDRPLPHLILVADEFAELKKNEPDFMSGLVSVARVGRSLGIHMVLATQKPSGVVDDQIWANSQFRLCLKVQSAADSREMLKNPDAASINRPGRLYVQVGENEIYELLQSYWSGAPYAPEKTTVVDDSNQLKVVMTSGERFSPLKKKKIHTDVDEVAAVCACIIRTSKEEGIEKLTGPWLPELPEYITLDQVLRGKKDMAGIWENKYEWLQVPVGLYDNPTEQSQGMELIDFVEEGHMGIYGAPSTGKTMLLKTIMLSAAMNFTPDDVQMYVLDCGGWSTSEFADMPHIGGIALDCETEKVEKLEKLMWDELEYRKNLLLQHHVSSLKGYREAIGKDVPAILFCIDNFPAVFELFPDMENLFITLSGQGVAYGIYLVFTSNSSTGIRFKVMQNIKNAIAFEMTDRGDYPTLVGRLEGVSPSKIPGRGLKKGSPPLEIHSAVYMDGETEAERSANLRKLLQDMSGRWTGQRPKPIPVMPNTISKESLEEAYAVRNSIPVGISFTTIRPCLVNLKERYNLVITGDPGSGKSRLLMDIFSMIHRKQPGDLLYVFDSKVRSLSKLKETATGYTVSDDHDSVTRILDQIVDLLNHRVRNKKQLMKENPDGFDENEYMDSLDQICVFIDNEKEFVDEVADESRDSMVRIAHLAGGLGVMIFAACRTEDLASYATIESLTVQLLKNQQGISLSGNALSCTMFHENLSYTEKAKDLKEGEAYYFNNGQCDRFRRPDL